MKLKVLGSGSSGNCYLLQNKDEVLILECGVDWKAVKKALAFDLSKVVGCLVTHEHKDHCKYVKRVIDSGIDTYMSAGTKEEIGINSHRIHAVKALQRFEVGTYTIILFETKHDCSEPVGFLIHHPDMGTMLFATDTYYVEYKFDNLNHILIECNYSVDILNEGVEKGEIHPGLRNRIIKSHFELGNVKDFLKANDLTAVRNIVLIHLSSANSNARQFKKEIEELTYKQVFVAAKGVEVNVGINPF